MWTRILAWQIGDGEVPAPTSGTVLKGLGLRLDLSWSDATDPLVTVDGVTTWARFDDAASIMETVVSMTNCSIVTERPATSAEPLPEVGAAVRWTGCLVTMGDYEFDAFELPDVRQAWTVRSVGDADHRGLLVDLHPVGRRCLDRCGCRATGDQAVESTATPPVTPASSASP